jgi:hypothetical protein
MFRLQGRWIAAVLVAAASLHGTARADDKAIAQQLTAYEAEAQRLGANLPRPNQTTGAVGQRRLLDAQVAFALGNYDAAALMLFELATRPGADQETASFYLAEALFQKGDRGAARSYYEQVVAGNNVASRYYQPSLERLIEISIVQNDYANTGDYLGALDRVSPGLRLPSVPYVRGKFAYAQGKHDEAIAYFNEVPKGSEYELQAAYFAATAYVAKQDLGRATDIFTDLVARKPKSSNDRRIQELSQLALGRLYYERDQASKSIDAYLLVDRHSDLFADALYEVAWVYVKSKQFDKALRALELLSLSDPQSQKTPTVRILEGNLRIRKAQMIRAAQILGTLDAREQDDPATEYDKAAQVFTDTHELYHSSYAALDQMASSASPEQFLTQIAGRSEHVFQAAAPIPEAAVQYLRDEPEVQRVVAVETDLGDITANIAETEETIARLEGVLAANDRTAVYPALQQRRTRIGVIQDDLIKLRSQLADEIAAGSAAPETTARRAAITSYTALPSAEHVAAEQAAQSRAQYNGIDNVADEIDDTIGATQAMSVALRKYMIDTPTLASDQRQAMTQTLDAAAREAQAIEDELEAARREIQIGRDLAGVGDPAIAQAHEARKAARAAEDAEARVLSGPRKALADRAASLAAQLDQAEAQIDAAVDQGLAEVRAALVTEKSQLAAFKAELATYEGATGQIGGELLSASFKTVKAKLYDIDIRTDVGNVDVAWSQKEDNDDDLKRLNLSRQRELKQLKDEFKDILDGGVAKPSAPAKKTEMPAPAPAPSGSPDQGGPDRRIAPGSDKPAPAAPTVKPTDTKAAAKKGGSK